MKDSRLGAIAVFLLIVASAMLIRTIGGSRSPYSLPINIRAHATPSSAATFVGWRDDFTNTAYVSASSGLTFTGTDVRLPVGGLERRGLVLGIGGPGDFDSNELGSPSVLLDGGIYRMWYYGCTPGYLCQIGYASSSDGQLWTKQGVVLSPSAPLEGSSVTYPAVIKIGIAYRMWYTGYDGATYRIFAANSADGLNWTKQGLVLDVGSSGSYDDRGVFSASVVYRGSSYLMWYTASRWAAPYDWVIMLATSTDGLNWTRQGVVLGPGPAGSLEGSRVSCPTVRLVGTQLEMLHTGMDASGTERLFTADSVDGFTWQRTGMVLDVLSPDESPTVTLSTFVVEANGTWSVYYTARGAQLQIYHGMRPLPGPQTGWLRSNPVSIPQGLTWAWFNQTATYPQNTSLNVSVLDGQTLVAIPGLENVTSGPIDLSGISPSSHGSLVLIGTFYGDGNSTPILDSWEISWTDSAPPTFAGLSAASDLGTGGSVQLTWITGSDPSPPITYSVYAAAGLSQFNYSQANATTAGDSISLTGLVNGVLYKFVVRATDRWGNQELNTVTKSVIPTTPVDSTPPNFAGLASATDVGTGGTVRLTWEAAVDPVPPWNTAPSLPIEYLAFAAANGSDFVLAAPNVVTENLSAVVTGLTDGTTYLFLVRAMDHVGNLESNTVVRSAIPTHRYDDVPPVFSGVGVVTDRGDGSSVIVSWTPATDPNTPQSNAPPSLPITYDVWVSDDATTLGSGQPSLSTQAGAAVVGGLQPGRAYYVLVRASDAAGNHDSNLRIVSFHVATPWWAYWWVFVLVAGGITVVGYLVLRRRSLRKPPVT